MATARAAAVAQIAGQGKQEDGVEVHRHMSLCVYDMRYLPVGGAMRTLSGTPEQTLKIEGPRGGAG